MVVQNFERILSINIISIANNERSVNTL